MRLKLDELREVRRRILRTISLGAKFFIRASPRCSLTHPRSFGSFCGARSGLKTKTSFATQLLFTVSPRLRLCRRRRLGRCRRPNMCMGKRTIGRNRSLWAFATAPCSPRRFRGWTLLAAFLRAMLVSRFAARRRGAFPSASFCLAVPSRCGFARR